MKTNSGKLYAVAVVVCLAAVGCFLRAREPSTFTAQPVTTAPASLLARMTLEDKAAQMVMVNLTGTLGPSRGDEELVRNIGIGGVCRRRWNNLGTAVRYIARLHVLGKQNRLEIPPFVAGRYTCGLGQYLDNVTGVTPLPTQMAVAAAGDPANAYLIASIAAREMRAAGITMNLAPLLEITPNERKERFSTRRFGSDPERVSAFGVQAVKGFQDSGVLAVPAGFPGLPDSPVRHGQTLPAINETVLALSMTDLKPFRDAAMAGADGIAVTDVALPSIDSSDLPAMLSREVLTGVLRELWGFQGLIIADTINTKAIRDNFEARDAIVKAINAGADMLISVGGQWRHLTTIAHIVNAVRKGDISEETLDTAVLRILRLKQKYGLLDSKPPELKQAVKTCGQLASRAASGGVLRRAITILKNDADLLPLDLTRYESVFVTGVVGVQQMAKILEQHTEGVTHFESRVASYNKWTVPPEDIADAEEMAQTADLTIVCTYSTSRIPRGQESLVKHLARLNRPLLVVSLGSPFDITYLGTVQACIASYGPAASPRFVAANMGSTVEFMLGDWPAKVREPGTFTVNEKERTHFDIRDLVRTPTGRLPAALSDRFPRGFGWTRDTFAFLSEVTWDFGDGSRAEGITANHAYQDVGKYVVRINLVTSRSNATELSFPLTVLETPHAQ